MREVMNAMLTRYGNEAQSSGGKTQRKLDRIYAEGIDSKNVTCY